MIKNIFYLLLAIFIFISGFAISKMIFNKKQSETNNNQATVLLEQIDKVFKLVTVEGNFSEIYNEQNIKEYKVFLPLPNTFRFPKKATLQVEGKVLVGFNMNNIKITVDSTKKELILDNVPKKAEILAVDHTLKYKNLNDSFFNSFNVEDYTNLNKNAKEVLRQKALKSKLMTTAESEGAQLLEAVELLVEAAGWTVTFKRSENKSTSNIMSN